MGSIASETPSQSRTALPFQPNDDQLEEMPLFRKNRKPRYLFRIYAPKTAGTTTKLCVEPPAPTCSRKDVFSLNPTEAASKLNAHLRWWGWHEKNCNFVSWTSSLLFALQYGVYRHCLKDQTPDMCDIRLLLVDTSGFPQGTFVKDLEIMSVFDQYSEQSPGKNLHDMFQLRTNGSGYYFGEYLTQGYINLEGACVETNMQQLIDAGLFDLVPGLGDRSTWDEWAKQVCNLRRPLLDMQGPSLVSKRNIRMAILIAEKCFGDQWVIPMATMLLGLNPCKGSEDTIAAGITAVFDEEEINELSLANIDIDAEGLPEVEQFQRIIASIQSRVQLEHITNDITNLTVTESP